MCIWVETRGILNICFRLKSKSMFETFEMVDAQALLDPVDAASVQEELCEEVVDQHGFFEP